MTIRTYLIWGGAMLAIVPVAPAAVPFEAVPANVKTIDSSENAQTNSLGGRNGVYKQEPSLADFTKSIEFGKTGSGLKISFDKKGEGGARNDGGFCGFYTVLHKGPDDYLDASPYAYLMFWVRGDKGGEKFKIGAADKRWGDLDDSVKSKEVGSYLRSGKITTEWQLAIVPLSEFPIDWKQTHALSICFEHDLFEAGAAQGAVYIDEISLVQEKPSD
jgi:hypothetical protein